MIVDAVAVADQPNVQPIGHVSAEDRCRSHLLHWTETVTAFELIELHFELLRHLIFCVQRKDAGRVLPRGGGSVKSHDLRYFLLYF